MRRTLNGGTLTARAWLRGKALQVEAAAQKEAQNMFREQGNAGCLSREIVEGKGRKAGWPRPQTPVLS